MNWLIDVSGSAEGLQLVPTFSREYTIREGVETRVNLDKIFDDGFEGFARFPVGINNCTIIAASGMENCLQVKKRYKWQKHDLSANVPIYTYCDKGWCASLLLYIKDIFAAIKKEFVARYVR